MATDGTRGTTAKMMPTMRIIVAPCRMMMIAMMVLVMITAMTVAREMMIVLQNV
jgi:hypothetical protein